MPIYNLTVNISSSEDVHSLAAADSSATGGAVVPVFDVSLPEEGLAGDELLGEAGLMTSAELRIARSVEGSSFDCSA